MKISISIMAHPSRKEYAEHLYTLLGDNFCQKNIVYDTHNNEWDTGKRSLLTNDPGADWHIVIQDDAIIHDNFFKNVFNALSVNKRVLTSFYVGQSRPWPERVKNAVYKAKLDNYNWLEAETLFWGVCIAIPVEQINPVLDLVDNIKLEYDQRIGQYYVRNSIKVRYTIPSLVNHRDETSLIMGHNERAQSPRVAFEYVEDRLVQWNTKVLSL